MRRAIAPLWFALVAAFLLATAASPARSEPVSPVDTKAVRAVVEAQLDAFAADDAKKAFSYAAPSIRGMFRTPWTSWPCTQSGCRKVTLDGR